MLEEFDVKIELDITIKLLYPDDYIEELQLSEGDLDGYVKIPQYSLGRYPTIEGVLKCWIELDDDVKIIDVNIDGKYILKDKGFHIPLDTFQYEMLRGNLIMEISD